jgi:ubiquitin-protein ligase
MQRTFYLHMQKELDNESHGWKKDDIDFLPDLPANADDVQKASKFHSGSFYFGFPGHENTTVTLKFPSSRSYAEAEWTIDSDDSLYHPGSHTGRLVFPSNFPRHRPQIIWDSPILSAFVRKGSVCVDYEWQRQPFYDVLYGLAAVVIFGPELEITTNPDAPQRKYRCRSHSKRSPILLDGESGNTDKDWMMRVMSFFSRVYNRPYNDGEIDELRQIAEIQRKTALKAIADFEEHIGLHKALTKDPNIAFKQVVTQGELQREERAWANELNDASSGMIAQGWGRVETCEEHSQRLAPRPIT